MKKFTLFDASAEPLWPPKKDRLPLYLAIFYLILGFWFSSGSLAPYALSTSRALVEKCGYLLNPDDAHFKAGYLMLNGAPRSTYEFSEILRRLLHPILSFPFFKIFGYLKGGSLFNLCLHIYCAAYLWKYFSARYSKSAAIIGLAAFVAYPGIYYWIALPYSYAMIVPCSLFSYFILERIQQSERLKDVAILSLMLGVLFTGYDLLNYFILPWGFVVIKSKRKFYEYPLLLLCLLAPQLLITVILVWGVGLRLNNENTKIYVDLISSYFKPIDLSAWLGFLPRFPQSAIATLFYANFGFLLVAATSIAIFAKTISKKWDHLRSPILWVLFANIFLFFCFVNLAPPFHAKWDLRGSGIARLYEPVFVVSLFFLVSSSDALFKQIPQSNGMWLRNLLLTFLVIGNGLTIFGLAYGGTIADYFYSNFYAMSSPVGTFKNNLATFGVHRWFECW